MVQNLNMKDPVNREVAIQASPDALFQVLCIDTENLTVNLRVVEAPEPYAEFVRTVGISALDGCAEKLVVGDIGNIYKIPKSEDLDAEQQEIFTVITPQTTGLFCVEAFKFAHVVKNRNDR